MAPNRILFLTLLSVILAACQKTTPPPLPADTAGPDPSAATNIPATPPPVRPTAAPSTAPTLAPSPAPTSLAEGMIVRLGTPDPSPNCPEHYPWFFENPAAECASYVLNTWATLQSFEHGLMVWFQEGGRVYVLYDDGSLFKPVRQVYDVQGGPLPGPDPALQPPPGLYQPELGFALFWRGLVPGHDWVRAQLGWATAPEEAYSSFWQCNTASGDAARCYFNGPHDEIIVFTFGSARYWNYWQRAVRGAEQQS